MDSPIVPAKGSSGQEVPAGFWHSPWPWLLLLFALHLGAPYVPVPNRVASVAAFLITTALYVVAVVQFIARGTRQRWSVPLLLASGGACLLFWYFLDQWAIPASFESIKAAAMAKQRPSGQAIFQVQLLQVAADAALLGASVMSGSLVARLITSPNMLGPICGVIALIDIWGVLFSGPVSKIIEKAPEIANKAMPDLPAAGALSKTAQFAIQPLQIGVGDYLFLGLLFAALHFNHMNWRGAIKLAIPFIFIALMLTFPFGAIPGLLPIGLAVALPNLKYFQYTRDEKFALIWASVFVFVLSAGAYLAVLRALPETPKKQAVLSQTAL